MENNNFVGERIRKRRTELDLTLKDLSEKCGILPQLISDYENGRKEPGLKNIKLISAALEIFPEYLINEDYRGFDNGKINTYGHVLRLYFEALELSKKDELDINREKGTVDIHIKDEILVKMLLQAKNFIDAGGDAGESIKNFNINILSEIEIKK